MKKNIGIVLLGTGALTLANIVMIHNGAKYRKSSDDFARIPFNVEEYENRYNH